MDTMTLTKIAGGVCGAWLILLLGKWAADEVYHMDSHGEQAYVIDTGVSEEAVEDVAEVPFAEVLASADLGKGSKVFNKCKACHKLEDGANGTGPYLYGIVGRDIANDATGFGYSGVLGELAGDWTVEELNAFLTSPKEYAPGNKMSFAGLKKVEDRANLIAYLDSLDD